MITGEGRPSFAFQTGIKLKCGTVADRVFTTKGLPCLSSSALSHTAARAFCSLQPLNPLRVFQDSSLSHCHSNWIRVKTLMPSLAAAGLEVSWLRPPACYNYPVTHQSCCILFWTHFIPVGSSAEEELQLCCQLIAPNEPCSCLVLSRTRAPEE